MKKRTAFILLVMAVLVISGCQDQQTVTPASTEAAEVQATAVPAPTAEESVAPTAEPEVEPAADAGAQPAVGTAGESTLPEDVNAQLDAYLQSQVYTEGGDPVGAAPGLVLYVRRRTVPM